MPVPPPAWRVRKRPCPFFWQGKCLFADSCNFLHSINPPAPTIVVNTASPESVSSQTRTSIESHRGIEGVFADDEDSVDSRESEPPGGDETLSSDWVHLSRAQATSTPPHQPLPVGSDSSAQSQTDHDDEPDTDAHSERYSASSLPYDRPSSRTDSVSSSSAGSNGGPGIGLGLILTPISPPRDVRQSLARALPHQGVLPAELHRLITGISTDDVDKRHETDASRPSEPSNKSQSIDTIDTTAGDDDFDAYEDYFHDESILGQAPVSSPPPMAPPDLSEATVSSTSSSSQPYEGHHSHSEKVDTSDDELNEVTPVQPTAASFYPSPSSPLPSAARTVAGFHGITSAAMHLREASDMEDSLPLPTRGQSPSAVSEQPRSRAGTASSVQSLNSLEGAAIVPIHKAAHALARVMLAARPPRSETSVPPHQPGISSPLADVTSSSPEVSCSPPIFSARKSLSPTVSVSPNAPSPPAATFTRPPAARRVARTRAPAVYYGGIATTSPPPPVEPRTEAPSSPAGGASSTSQGPAAASQRSGSQRSDSSSSLPQALLSPVQLQHQGASEASLETTYAPATPTAGSFAPPTPTRTNVTPSARSDVTARGRSDVTVRGRVGGSRTSYDASASDEGHGYVGTFGAGTSAASSRSSSVDQQRQWSSPPMRVQAEAVGHSSPETTSRPSTSPSESRRVSIRHSLVSTSRHSLSSRSSGRTSPVPPPSAPPSFMRRASWHEQAGEFERDEDVTIHAGQRPIEPPLRSAPLTNIRPDLAGRRRSRQSKHISGDSPGQHDSGSGSSTSSHSTAPSWLKPLRLGSSTPVLSDDAASTGRASRPVSIYSVASAPNITRVPPTILSRPPSVVSLSRPLSQSRPSSALRLDTAIASHRNSVLGRRFPFASASPSQPQTRRQLIASPESKIPAASIPLPQTPLLPPAQIYTSTSRSLSPPHNQPLFKLSDTATPSPSFSAFSAPTPTIYSPPLSASAIDKSSASLFFAIASDDKSQVTQSLKDASPNTAVGPGEVPALVFTITNDQLSNKLPIVKTLLEHGADPAVVFENGADPKSSALKANVEDDVSPAMKYYLERAAALNKDPMAEALRKSELASICGAGFRIVGQDHMLRHLYRAIRLYISGAMANPFVAILAGPSGLGKSYIAKQLGEILSVPAHVINLSSLRSQSSLLEMKPALADAGANNAGALQDFLATNEGKRCVVVLEDIEKVEDINALHSLIVPFELGRFLLATGAYVDTSKVLWFATSSVGSAGVLELYAEGSVTDGVYRQMMSKARGELSAVLGASLVSRVGSVLPFVPFSDVEKGVIVCEAASALLARVGESYAPDKMDELVRKIVAEHHEIDGRGLLRAVAEQF